MDRVSLLSCFCSVLVLSAFSSAQSYVYTTGQPPWTTPEPVELGAINLANGNLRLSIPITASPQRGARSFSAALVYDSRIWRIVQSGTSKNWQPTNVEGSQGGWRFVTSADVGSVGFQYSYTLVCENMYAESLYTGFWWTDPEGYRRYFPITTSDVAEECGGGQDSPNGEDHATDSSGFKMVVTDFTTATVYAPDGTQVYPQLKDSNGNYFSVNSGNKVDTLGRTPVLKSTSGNQTYYDVLDSQNSATRPRFTVTTTSISVNTNFGQSGVSEYSGSITVIQSVSLPDGTSYTFDYDSGTSPGKFGLLKSVTLRTGGQVSYTYTTFSDSYGNRNRWVATRAAGGGTWSYTPAVISTCSQGGSGCQHKVTVSKPSADEAIYRFYHKNGAWNTRRDFYSGTASSGTLVKTEVTDFDFSDSAGNYVRPTRLTSTFPTAGGGSISRKTELVYDSAQYGNVTQVKEWGFYTASPPSTPLRTTEFAYLHASNGNYLTRNILNRPVSRVVNNSAGTQVAKTLFSYDTTSLTLASGIIQHDGANYGTGFTYRGNPTLDQVWVSGPTYLNTTKTYDTTGQLRQVTDPAGNSTSYSYTDNYFHDNGSNPPQAYTPTTATNAYVTQITRPITGAESFGHYFNTGKQAFSKDPNDADTFQHYLDPLDRLTHTYQPLTNGVRGWSLTVYTSATQQDTYTALEDTSPSASCTSCRHQRTVLDTWGATISTRDIKDPQGVVYADTEYDTSGRKWKLSNPYRTTSDPTYGWETSAYDGLDRVTTVTRADSAQVKTFYGATVTSNGGIGTQLCSTSTYGIGFLSLAVDEAGKKRQQWTDGLGRIIETDEPDSSNSLTLATCYKYDVLNNAIEVNQGAQTRAYAYDAAGRLTSETHPESGTTAYHYTTSGGALCSGSRQAVCRRTDARSVTTTYAYDALNRETSRTYSDSTPSVSYFYDQASYNGLTITNGKSRRTGMSDGSGQAAWSYDGAGRALTEQRKVNTITKSTSQSYDLSGNVKTITYPSGRVITYTYSNAGRVISAVDSGNSVNYALSGQYAPHGSLSSAVYGQVSGGFAGITTTNTFNNRLQPVILSAAASSTVFSFSYGYGASNNGNVLQIQNNIDNGRTLTYTYDELRRLKTATTQATSGPNCWGQSLGYDRYGNLLSSTVTQCSAPSLSVSVSSANQITNSGFSYDAAGSMTADGSYSYTWDAENRLKAAGGVNYKYDGDGRRMESARLYWYGLNGEVLAESDLSGNITTELIYFAGREIAEREAGGTVRYLFADHVDSTRVVTSATGTVLRDSDYYAFGGELVVTGTASHPHKFTGKERDTETTLDHSHYRKYSSTLGRWLSTDPVRGKPGDPQRNNLYSYVNNNPANLVDACGNDFHNPFSPFMPPFGPCSPFPYRVDIYLDDILIDPLCRGASQPCYTKLCAIEQGEWPPAELLAFIQPPLANCRCSATSTLPSADRRCIYNCLCGAGLRLFQPFRTVQSYNLDLMTNIEGCSTASKGGDVCPPRITSVEIRIARARTHRLVRCDAIRPN